MVGRWIDRVLIGGLRRHRPARPRRVILVAAELAGTRDIRLSLQAIGFIGLVFSSVLFMRAVAQVLRRERSAIE